MRHYGRRHRTGVTLTEYALLLGLIAVACIAALSLLGGSVSNLYKLVAQACGPVQPGMLVKTAGSGANSSGSPSHTGNTPNSPEQNLTATATQSVHPSQVDANGDPGDSNPDDALTPGSQSGGTNVTSVEGTTGSIQGVHHTLSTAQTLDELADQTDDVDLKAWYRNASISIYNLSGTEASYSYTQGVKQLAVMADTGQNAVDALWNMHQYYMMLNTGTINAFPEKYKGTPVEAKAMAMVNGVVDNMWSQYGNALSPYSSTSSNGILGGTLDIQSLKLDAGLTFQKNYAYSSDEIRSRAQTALASGSLNGAGAEAIRGAVVTGEDFHDKGKP